MAKAKDEIEMLTVNIDSPAAIAERQAKIARLEKQEEERREYEASYFERKCYERALPQAETIYAVFWFWCRWKGYDIYRQFKAAWEKYIEENDLCVQIAKEYCAAGKIERKALHDVVIKQHEQERSRRNADKKV